MGGNNQQETWNGVSHVAFTTVVVSQNQRFLLVLRTYVFMDPQDTPSNWLTRHVWRVKSSAVIHRRGWKGQRKLLAV